MATLKSALRKAKAARRAASALRRAQLSLEALISATRANGETLKPDDGRNRLLADCREYADFLTGKYGRDPDPFRI